LPEGGFGGELSNGKVLAAQGLVQSRQKKGSCHDHTTIERFFDMLKSESFVREIQHY